MRGTKKTIGGGTGILRGTSTPQKKKTPPPASIWRGHKTCLLNKLWGHSAGERKTAWRKFRKKQTTSLVIIDLMGKFRKPKRNRTI